MKVELVIVDRTLEDARWLLRRQVGMAPGVGKEFAKWIADPARGRFLIIKHGATSPEEYFDSVADESALIENIAQRCLDAVQHQLKTGVPLELFTISRHTTLEVKQKLDRLMSEIEQEVREANEKLTAAGQTTVTVPTAISVVDMKTPP